MGKNKSGADEKEVHAFALECAAQATMKQDVMARLQTCPACDGVMLDHQSLSAVDVPVRIAQGPYTTYWRKQCGQCHRTTLIETDSQEEWQMDERTAFEHGYAICLAELMHALSPGEQRDESKEKSYDRWVRLGRDLKRYLNDPEYLDAEKTPPPNPKIGQRG